MGAVVCTKLGKAAVSSGETADNISFSPLWRRDETPHLLHTSTSAIGASFLDPALLESMGSPAAQGFGRSNINASKEALMNEQERQSLPHAFLKLTNHVKPHFLREETAGEVNNKPQARLDRVRFRA